MHLTIVPVAAVRVPPEMFDSLAIPRAAVPLHRVQDVARYFVFVRSRIRPLVKSWAGHLAPHSHLDIKVHDKRTMPTMLLLLRARVSQRRPASVWRGPRQPAPSTQDLKGATCVAITWRTTEASSKVSCSAPRDTLGTIHYVRVLQKLVLDETIYNGLRIRRASI